MEETAFLELIKENEQQILLDSDILPNQGHLYDHLSFSEIGIQQIGLPTPAFPRLQSALFHIRTYALVVVSCTCIAGFVSLGYEPVDYRK